MNDDQGTNEASAVGNNPVGDCPAPPAPVAPTPGSETVDVWQCEFFGSTLTTPHLDDIMAEMDGADPGEVYTVTRVRMPKSEYDALPEFDGF